MSGVMITEVGSAWSAVTFTSDERWQVRKGAIRVTYGASEPANLEVGLHLEKGSIIDFDAGQSIHYRRIGPLDVEIAREVL